MSKGFTVIEILVAAFILATVAIAVTGLSLAVTRWAFQAERKNVAQSIANEEMENARTYSYAQIEYADAEPPGKIERTKNIERNHQSYTVDSLVTSIDDPLTKETKDFKQLTIKISWPRAEGGVVISSFFTKSDKRQSGDSCIPGTVTCPDPKGCTPATQSCSTVEPFLPCPASGSCSDIVGSPIPSLTPAVTGGQHCQIDKQCASGEICLGRSCQPAWCEIVRSAPLIDIGACEGQLVIEDCTNTCPSYRRLGELGKVPICGRDSYCVITSYSFERCVDSPACNKPRIPTKPPQNMLR